MGMQRDVTAEWKFETELRLIFSQGCLYSFQTLKKNIHSILSLTMGKWQGK